MTELDHTQLLQKLQQALPQQPELLRALIKELSDKEEMFERLEDVVAEKTELAERLSQAEQGLQSAGSQSEELERLRKDFRELKTERARLAEEVQLRQGGGVSSAGGDEMRAELEKLRQTRDELEQDLIVRDDILGQLREDFQKIGGGSDDVEQLRVERDNYAEQLTLALSQLEEVASKDRTVQRLDQMTKLCDDLESQMQQKATESQHLLSRAQEAEERCKEFERGRSETADEEQPPNTLGVLIAGALIGIAIFVGYNHFKQPVRQTKRPISGVAVVHQAPVGAALLEKVVLARLTLQQMSTSSALERVARKDEQDVGRLREAVDLALDGEDTYRRLLAYLALGRFQEALGTVEVLEREQKRMRALLDYFRGRASFFVGRSRDASIYLRLSLEKDNDLADAWRALGDVYSLSEQTEDALRCYREAIRAQPEDALAYAALGGLFNLKDEPEEAMAAFEKAINIDPKLAEAHYALGLLLQRKEDWGRACESFEEAIVLESDNPRSHYYLSRCYDVLGKKDKSRHHRERARELGYSGPGAGSAAGASDPPGGASQ